MVFVLGFIAGMMLATAVALIADWLAYQGLRREGRVRKLWGQGSSRLLSIPRDPEVVMMDPEGRTLWDWFDR